MCQPMDIDQLLPLLPQIPDLNLPLEENVQAPPVFDNIHLQIGMVLVQPELNSKQPVIQVDATSKAHPEHFIKQSAEGLALWTKHFAPMTVSDNSNVVQVPENWADIFTVSLLSPHEFNWAKQFLASKAWEIIKGLEGKNFAQKATRVSFNFSRFMQGWVFPT